MSHEWIQIIASFTGSIGFSLLFGLHGRQLPIAAIGAALTWAIYLGVCAVDGGIFLATVLASIFAGIYTEIMVRRLKVPKTVLTFSVVVTLIPGRDLYNTMRFAIDGDLQGFLSSGVVTLGYAVSIAIGITIVLVGSQLFTKARAARMAKRNS